MLRVIFRVYWKLQKLQKIHTDTSTLDRHTKAVDKSLSPHFRSINPHIKEFQSLPFAPLFIPANPKDGDISTFSRARSVLQENGFLVPNTDEAACVGVMDERVQKTVREHILATDTQHIRNTWTKEILDTLEVALRSQCWYGRGSPKHASDTDTLSRLRLLRPCLEKWCEHMCKPTSKHLCGRERVAHDLVQILGDLSFTESNYTSAQRKYKQLLEFRQQTLPANHVDVNIAMHKLAATCSELRQYEVR